MESKKPEPKTPEIIENGITYSELESVGFYPAGLAWFKKTFKEETAVNNKRFMVILHWYIQNEPEIAYPAWEAFLLSQNVKLTEKLLRAGANPFAYNSHAYVWAAMDRNKVAVLDLLIAQVGFEAITEQSDLDQACAIAKKSIAAAAWRNNVEAILCWANSESSNPQLIFSPREDHALYTALHYDSTEAATTLIGFKARINWEQAEKLLQFIPSRGEKFIRLLQISIHGENAKLNFVTHLTKLLPNLSKPLCNTPPGF